MFEDRASQEIIKVNEFIKIGSYRTGVFIRGDIRDAQRKSHVQTQREGGHLPATERGLRKNQTCPHFGFGLAASRTVRKLISVF